jgi:hypothetical protein
MISDLVNWLLATFVLAPVQAEIDDKLKAANASRAVVEQVQTCLAAAPPRLVEKANGDWIWTATTVISVATGLSSAEQVLADNVPACGPAMEAARPFLRDDNRV